MTRVLIPAPEPPPGVIYDPDGIYLCTEHLYAVGRKLVACTTVNAGNRHYRGFSQVAWVRDAAKQKAVMYLWMNAPEEHVQEMAQILLDLCELRAGESDEEPES